MPNSKSTTITTTTTTTATTFHVDIIQSNGDFTHHYHQNVNPPSNHYFSMQNTKYSLGIVYSKTMYMLKLKFFLTDFLHEIKMCVFYLVSVRFQMPINVPVHAHTASRSYGTFHFNLERSCSLRWPEINEHIHKYSQQHSHTFFVAYCFIHISCFKRTHTVSMSSN